MALVVSFSVALPVKRILSKPHIGRSPSSNLHTNVTLGHSPAAGRSLLKVQRNSHKPLYDSNNHIRVSAVKLSCVFENVAWFVELVFAVCSQGQA